MLLAISSRAENALQLFSILLLFIFVLVITYITTRWIAKIQKGQLGRSLSNIEVIETQSIGNNKFIQIVRTGEKYLVIAVGKDEVTFLSELSKDEINFSDNESGPAMSFQAVFDKVKNLNSKKED